MTSQVLMARAHEGGGDQILALNCALAWAKTYNVTVELEYHWQSEQDFKYVESDPDFLGERFDLMHSKMKEPHLLQVEHVWGSEVFEYHGATDDYDLRRIITPRKWFMPHQNNLHPNHVPFGAQLGQAEWTFSDSPKVSNKIVVWDYELNKEPPRKYKTSLCLTWSEVIESTQKLFPDHEIVVLSYRDSFERAYMEIKDCAFCLGYDGMWHLVARNFGKLFVTMTGDVSHTHRNTNPLCSAFFVEDDQILGYLSRLTDPEYLSVEQDIASRYHEKRMRWYGNPKR